MIRLVYTFIIVAAILAPCKSLAQGVTTGNISGIVSGTIDGKSSTLSGATVKATSVATGAVYGAVARAGGKYSIRGLRPGAYNVTCTYVGFKITEKNMIQVDVGETTTLNIVMAETSNTNSKEVLVIADQNSLFDKSRTGSGSVIDQATIAAAPTINRSISDIARLNPYTNQTQTAGSDGLQGVSISGVNSRFNNFQIDGAVANDVFALGSAGTAGSQANSNFISLDAIERLRVNVSPYDIRQSGFTGGLVNAITRGGTNNLAGSVFIYGRNQDLVGLSPDISRSKFDNFSDVQFGGRIGGPIVENTLLFHVTAEVRMRSLPLEVGINDPNSLINFPVPTRDFDSVISISKRLYGYDPGTYSAYSNRSNSYNIIARLDYNLNESHKLQFRHNFTYGDTRQKLAARRANV